MVNPTKIFIGSSKDVESNYKMYLSVGYDMKGETREFMKISPNESEFA